MIADTRKSAILAALRAFIRQRPGMDPRNYDAGGYRREYREVLRDKHDAEHLLGVLSRDDGITADDILREAGGGGRLTVAFNAWEAAPVRAEMLLYNCKHCGLPASAHGEAPFTCTVPTVDYTTGQYFPTEYRKAAARLAAAVLWAHVREYEMPVRTKGGMYHFLNRAGVKPMTVVMSAGDWLRAYFKREFGRHLAARYFT